MTEDTEAAGLKGLSTPEAQRRLQQYGPNSIPEEHPRRWLALLRKFWGPIPWMLEVTIVLQLALGKYVNLIITVALLLVNALLSFIQENRAQNALALLRQKLTIQARVMRDNQWQVLPAEGLVPGDLVYLRTGELVPADMRLLNGQVSADQSALTGESVPADIAVNGTAYAGSVIRQGEGAGEVTATGQKTYFGKTAELVHTAKTASHLETIIQRVVEYLVGMNVILAAVILAYTLIRGLPLSELLPFILILLVASVPIALPATFTLATALGSLELSRRGVVITRLSAIEEAAGMTVLCSDKTGTVTQNQLAVADSRIYAPYTQENLLQWAALASDEATQDPIDLAILSKARAAGINVDPAQRERFLPFDPLTKRTEAFVRQNERDLHIVKGFPQVVASMTSEAVDTAQYMGELADKGYRVLAVAAGEDNALHLVGLLGLQDPPRADSKAVIQKLRDLGVRVLMITGDSLATAKAIAQQVGITGEVCSPDTLRQEHAGDSIACEVFAEVYPEDKFKLVQTLQQTGYIVGMTGDGVNDAPALKQAEVGVAVANATDVAKAAASLVLTSPGLGDMVAAVEDGRRIYQRMLTYTLNKIVKTFQIGLFLTLGLLLTGDIVTRPRFVLLLLFANDFVTMALATDRVTFSPKPDRWNIRALGSNALMIALAWLVVSFAVLFVGLNALNLDQAHLQTLIFVMLVFSGQANVYLVRERGHFWNSMPSRWLLLSTAVDVLVVSLLAILGILMPAISPLQVGGLFVVVAVSMIGLDFVKIAAFRLFNTTPAAESP